MVPSKEYFLNKQKQSRKKISDHSELAFQALEVALRVYRLHYPSHTPWAHHFYWNNDQRYNPELITYFYPNARAKKHKSLAIADIYFLQRGISGEDESFVVEVAIFDIVTCHLAIVRWRNLTEETSPLVAGETVVVC